MTVGDTLEFAARLRTPQNRGDNIDRETYAKHMADAYMATYGISHTRNTKVGNDIVRGSLVENGNVSPLPKSH